MCGLDSRVPDVFDVCGAFNAVFSCPELDVWSAHVEDGWCREDSVAVSDGVRGWLFSADPDFPECFVGAAFAVDAGGVRVYDRLDVSVLDFGGAGDCVDVTVAAFVDRAIRGVEGR